jgi:carbon monoxide dehydrogenase subunit G
MKLEGTNHLNASRDRVFDCLTNPQVLERCIPGCERLEAAGENVYAATIRTGVGTIKGLFTGTVKLQDVRKPEHYRIVVEGKGSPGFLKGSGDLDLSEQEDGTLITYAGEIQVGGTIAGVGQRMIQGTAKMMTTQFFLALEAEAKTLAHEAPPTHGFFRTALRWFSGWLRRTFK